MDIAILQQAIKPYFDDAVIVSNKLMSYGKENTSVKVDLDNGKTLILRIWGEQHSHIGERKLSDIVAELSFMTHCHDAGIAVPKVYFSVAGNAFEQLPSGEYYMIMDYVEGESPRDLTADMVRQVARAMAQMHMLATTYNFSESRSWPGTVIDMTNARLDKLAESDKLDNAVRGYLSTTGQAYTKALTKVDLSLLPQGPIHGDIMWENLKFKDGKLAGIFDFDDCRRSYFLEDIVKTLLFEFDDEAHSFFGQNGEHAKLFLEEYQSVRPLTSAESELPLFFTAGYLYRLTAYIGKWLKGEEEYRAKIDALQRRYLENQSFFLE